MLDNVIADHQERTAALNPRKSFIVQAPAGSGKTELLTQRILILLAEVSAPEEILAITFTKKAAAEMRARLIHTLQRAQDATQPNSPHAIKTWELAKKVLQRDDQLNWRLLQNPNRLRIQTIDSFNSSLVKHLPISSHFGAPPEITDDAAPLYQEAVREFLSHLEENVAWSDAIAALLIHLDNDLNQVEKLLVNMLAKRDQWLPYIASTPDADILKSYFENNLRSIVAEAVAKVAEHFPKNYNDEIFDLIDFARRYLLEAGKESNFMHLSALPGNQETDKEHWLALSEFVLTKEFTWRKSFNINLGFPAPSSTKVATEKKLFSDMKQRMSDLIESLSQSPFLSQAFEALSHTPAYHYDQTQWDILQALYQVLRIVVAQLKVVFQKHAKIDYIENAYAALLALGSDDAPTDLALALDYQLKHILIDEFQDTSNSQYRLLEKLIAGWENNDGRTLFIVGDPMQSIYRFREAEVGLFIGARKKGIGQIHLEPLTLSVNFRSTPTIVDWVNHQFSEALPPIEDIASGAVSYSHSLANNIKTHATESKINLHPCLADDTAQASAIVNLIKELKKANPQETIAILVRSRTHLESIIPALKTHGLIYRAIDIDALDTRPVIQDLMMLTRALLNPEDRIAWLAVLRAPWCGLLLADLLQLSQDAHLTVIEAIHQRQDKFADPLSEKNLARVTAILNAKLTERKYHSLRDWVESTWLLLGGPACLQHLSDIEDAKTYLDLLETLSQGGDLIDLDQLERHVGRLYATPNSAADNSLQIMTIHNAKGLEFDTVILPQLQRRSAIDDKQLLLWMERHQQSGSSLILAPIHATGAEKDSIYAYIKKQHEKKADHETGRLLYVAATRAKKNLHLFFNVEMNAEKELANPNTNSLLNKIWNSLKESVTNNLSTENYSTTDNDQQKPTRKISRLSKTWQPLLKEIYIQKPPEEHQSLASFQIDASQAKQLGTLTHLILQKVSQHGASWWTDKSESEKKIYLHTQLLQQRALSSALHDLINTIMRGLDVALRDNRLRWILMPHTDAHSEWGLTTYIKNKLQSLVIDRTFIDEKNIRWIIDYKTTTPEEGLDLATFLRREQQKYQEKMHLYYQALKQSETREIRMGLYFPLITAWHEWSFETVAL